MQQYSIDYIIEMLQSDMSIDEIITEIERRCKEHETGIQTANVPGSKD